MNNYSLAKTIEQLAIITCSVPDASLEYKWSWQDYDEGIRHAFFRTYEELCELSVLLEAQRFSGNRPQTAAQRFLAQYHTAFRDLQAVLLGLNEAQFELSPAEGEWSVKEALIHIIQAEGTFFAITDYGLQRGRSNQASLAELSDEAWEAYWQNDPFETLKDSGTFGDLLDYYQSLHNRVLDTFATIDENELSLPISFWESKPMPVQFRLIRFTSHVRQHTIQIEKTLLALGLSPGEAKRLLRLVYQALAQLEGARIGHPTLGEAECDTLAETISARAHEIAIIVA